MTAPPVETYSILLPVRFAVPPVNPSLQGLYAATIWTEVTGPSRHLAGVEIRPAGNYGGEDASGVWETDWCGAPPLNNSERKEGTRPEGLDPFAPVTIWAYDECDLNAPSRAEVQQRAAQISRLREQVSVEREFSNRLLTDAGTPEQVDSFTVAVGYLEAEFARTNTVGYIHLGAQWAAVAAASQLIGKSGTRQVSPLGHTFVFGGGYVEGLEDTLVATSQPFGWRDETALRTAIDERHNIFAAIAERTVLVGYEAVIGAATVTP
ncbi:hypothetical protein KQR54_05600 [Mycobacterium gordonae]|uniref:hypothetical protein n=1 Tax=Mycobacterium gordonae TaxID=1778 RepID=UPI00210EADAD|nr:hypothetical protein [Mycobacterium gordonae]MCQ4360625.1 hypothetical protein [Mycobacterium gordonae]